MTIYKKRRPNRIWYLPRYISSFRSQQDLCSDPTEQILNPHRPEVVSETQCGKVNRARSTSVHCLRRLHEVDCTVTASEEILMEGRSRIYVLLTNCVMQGCVLAPTFFLSFYQQCRPRYSCTLQSEDENHKYTCEITSFRRRQLTDCQLSRGDLQDC